MSHTCPYLDLEDVRCSGRLTMHRLTEAYRLCSGNPAACRVYHVLAGEQAADHGAVVEEVVAA